MTDEDLFKIARAALPDRLKGATDLRIVRRGGVQPAALEQAAPQFDPKLQDELERILKIKFPSVPITESKNAVEVVVTEQTEVGARTIVMQIRDGKVVRRIGQV